MKDYYALTVRGRARRLRRLALVALNEYAINVKSVRLISNSFNGIFRVDTLAGEKYIMRVCRPSEDEGQPGQLRSEVMWLAALRRDSNLEVPEPIMTRNGSYLTSASIDGVPQGRYCVLFSWLRGRDLDQQMNDANMEAFGVLAARLHQQAALWEPPNDFSVYRFDRVFPFDEPVAIFNGEQRDILPQSRRELFEDTVRRLESAIARLKASSEPMRVLHGELHRWNIKVYRGRVAAFDFEEIMWGWPVQDIATTLYYFHGEREYKTLRVAFERGYTTVSPWPERYPGEIDLFIAGRGLVLANTILVDADSAVRAAAPAYFEHTELRLRALLNEDSDFLRRYW